MKIYKKRALHFLLYNYLSKYKDLLDKVDRSSMNVRRLWIFCVEIHKTINNLHPDFMEEIFVSIETKRPARQQHKSNLEIPQYNQTTFGKKGFGQKVCNCIQDHIKFSENLKSFYKVIKNWSGAFYTCTCTF